MFQIPEGQNSPIDTDTFHQHATELNFMVSYEHTSSEQLNLPVFDEDGRTVTTEQPRVHQTPDNRGPFEEENPVRRSIPVSVIDWETRDERHFIPASGLDFLQDQSQIIIRQTVEYFELRSNRDSAKRYLVKSPEGGDTLYYAMEESTNFQRMCFGSRRKFAMILKDRTQQDALLFQRRLACCACSFWCYLQVLEVWSSDEYLGCIKQEISYGLPCLTVRDIYNNIHYRIEGPPVCACRYAKEAYFKVYSADGMTQCGSINHFWNQVQVDYTLGVQFPSPNTDKKKKALLVGAAFLLEYMFFETSRNGSCACLC